MPHEKVSAIVISVIIEKGIVIKSDRVCELTEVTFKFSMDTFFNVDKNMKNENFFYIYFTTKIP